MNRRTSVLVAATVLALASYGAFVLGYCAAIAKITGSTS